MATNAHYGISWNRSRLFFSKYCCVSHVISGWGCKCAVINKGFIRICADFQRMNVHWWYWASQPWTKLMKVTAGKFAQWYSIFKILIHPHMWHYPQWFLTTLPKIFLYPPNHWRFNDFKNTFIYICFNILTFQCQVKYRSLPLISSKALSENTWKTSQSDPSLYQSKLGIEGGCFNLSFLVSDSLLVKAGTE